MSMVGLLTIIIFAGVVSQMLAWKYSIPAIVLMSICGLLLGPLTGFINPSQMIDGDLYKAFISLSVALILFEGSLSLDFNEIYDIRYTIKRIVTLGALIAWVLGGLAAYFIVGLSGTTSAVIGALLIVTGPTVIMPLLRQAKLNSKVASVLKWEGIIVDPIGALVAMFAFEAAQVINSPFVNLTDILKLGGGIGLAVLIGLVAGIFIGYSLKHNKFPEHLKAIIVLCTVIGSYTLSDFIMHETGLLAVTVMGVVLANQKLPQIEDVKHFNENISTLLTSAVFIMLTSSLDREILMRVFEPQILLFVAAMLFIVRPLSIWLSTIGTDMKKEEKALVGWIAPRGIVALTVTGYFANLLVEQGYTDASILVALTFALVICTVCLHGFTITPLAKKLGLAHKGNPGLVIVGANKFSVALADFLRKLEIPTLMVDLFDSHLELARKNNLNYHQGEILHEVDNYNLDLVIYRYMLINTPIPMYNIIVADEFIPTFGRGNICAVEVFGDKKPDMFKTFKHSAAVSKLAGTNATYLQLVDFIEQGYEFETVDIKADFNWDKYYQERKNQEVEILVVKSNNTICFIDENIKKKLNPGDKLVHLVKKQ